jgi:hypothetical protein
VCNQFFSSVQSKDNVGVANVDSEQHEFYFLNWNDVTSNNPLQLAVVVFQ